MTCRDAERLWNDLLDARGAPPPGLEARLDAHASACPACAGVATRYRTLRAAIHAWAPPPVASPESVERVLRANLVSVETIVLPPRRPRIAARAARISAAAAILVAAWIGLRAARIGGHPDPAPPALDVPGLSFADALAEAGSATLDLARETSAPAGRVGRVILASGALPTADRLPKSFGVSVVPTSEVLRSVGGRVGAGVRPLSGSARQAFGFLLRSAAGDDPAAPPPGT